jgi:hypothetical protein
MEKDLVAGAYLDAGARSRATAPVAMAMPDGCLSVEGARRQRRDGDAAVANHMTAAGGGVRAQRLELWWSRRRRMQAAEGRQRARPAVVRW